MDGPNARLAELSGAGRVIRVSGLPRHLLPQTEGITFGVDGTLYLASEGHYGLGVLAGWSKGVQASIIGCRHTVTASTPDQGDGMSRELADSHQAVGRSWLMRTRPVELLTRRHGDCIQLEARIRRARREIGSARSYGLQQALVEIESDLGTYAVLLAEREVHLGWEGPLPLGRGGGGSSDAISLGAAITEFVQRSRRDVAEAERLGDPESAGILAEIARVAETWLWDLATVPGPISLAGLPYAEVAHVQSDLSYRWDPAV